MIYLTPGLYNKYKKMILKIYKIIQMVIEQRGIMYLIEKPGAVIANRNLCDQEFSILKKMQILVGLPK
jgi:hypothetical protein